MSNAKRHFLWFDVVIFFENHERFFARDLLGLLLDFMFALA